MIKKIVIFSLATFLFVFSVFIPKKELNASQTEYVDVTYLQMGYDEHLDMDLIYVHFDFMSGTTSIKTLINWANSTGNSIEINLDYNLYYYLLIHNTNTNTYNIYHDIGHDQPTMEINGELKRIYFNDGSYYNTSHYQSLQSYLDVYLIADGDFFGNYEYFKGYAKGKSDGYDIGYIEAMAELENQLNNAFMNGKQAGRQEAINENLNNQATGMKTMLTAIFSGMGSLLAIELLPNITIGAIVLVPLVFGIIAFIVGRKSD